MALRDFLSRLVASREAGPRAQSGYTVTVKELSQLTADDLNGGGETNSGARVTALRALQNAAVYRAVNLIATAVASMPAQLFEEDAEDERSKLKAKKHPLYWLIYQQPNPRMGSFDFRRLMEADVLLRGNAYALIVLGADGYAQELWRLHPDRVEPLERSDFSIVYRYTRPDGRQVIFEAKEILHLRDLGTDGIKGLSRIQLAKEAIGLALRGEEHGARTLKQGAQIKLVLQSEKTLSDAAYDRLKQSINDNYSGAENAGKSIILEDGLTANAVGMTNADAEWLEARRYQVSEIAGMFFGIPPHLMGDQKQTNWGTGIEQQNIGMHQYTLLPETRLWEEGLNRALLKPADRGRLYFKLNASAYLRASAKDRGEYYGRALGTGGGQAWMTPNEVRALDELPPVEGGDSLPARSGVPSSSRLDDLEPE